MPGPANMIDKELEKLKDLELDGTTAQLLSRYLRRFCDVRIHSDRLLAAKGSYPFRHVRKEYLDSNKVFSLPVENENAGR